MTNIQEYMDEMKTIHSIIITFLDNEGNVEENFQNTINRFDDHKVHDDRHKIKLLLHLFTKLINNHYRSPNFFNKFERILLYFKGDMKKYFPNWEIFNIFKSNKRILLFLIDEKILFIDKYIINSFLIGQNSNKYIDSDYLQYFSLEIQQFVSRNRGFKKNKLIKSIPKEIPEKFYEDRKHGENNNYICKIIQKDLIDEFIEHVNQNNLSFNSVIDPSIFETNNFLIKKQIESKKQSISAISLIEYAAFFGSIQIFTYLFKNGVKLMPSLWLYAIHGNCSNIFQCMVDNHVEIEDKSYKQLLKESIKCHHKDIFDYISIVLVHNEIEGFLFEQGLKYYNFLVIEDKLINESEFLNFCKYDYYNVVDFLLKNKNIDINQTI